MIEEHTTPSTGSLGTPTRSSVRGADTRGVTSRVRHFFLAPVDLTPITLSKDSYQLAWQCRELCREVFQEGL